MKRKFSQYAPHGIAVIFFWALVAIYFAPAVFEGKVITQGDHIKASGMGVSQVQKYADMAEPGEFSIWSDAMFAGMPYGPGYGDPAPSLPSITYLDGLLKLPGYTHAAMVFTGLICFYIFLCVLGVNRWLAVGGAIAFAFASYNIIVIEAGHIVKAYVIGYMPLTLAGMMLLFRKKLFWGGILFLLGVAFSLMNGHVQITYYLVLLALFIYAGYTIRTLMEKKLVEWGQVSLIMLACVVLAALPNARNMYANWDLGQHSIRGQSELTPAPGIDGVAEKASTGLDKDYAFQWSYGNKELLTLLIPNAYGGSSGGFLGSSSALAEAMRQNGAQVGSEVQSYTYWGDKSFTSGPVYFGALVCFLFVLGMFAVRNPIKWWMLGGAAFLTFLALGRNFDAFNDFMFHHLPLYNKFRTVEMALVIPGLVFPIIGIWGLSIILKREIDERTFKRGMICATAIAGGICLIVWLAPSILLNFRSTMDEYYLGQMPEWYVSALITDRQSLASNDALRSLLIIAAGATLLYLFQTKMKNAKNAPTVVSIIISLIILFDLWNIDRRYLSEKNFTKERPEQTYKRSPADEFILKDPTESFRVLGLNNPWQNTDVSYFHHSIGGYHAVKLRRYQELIDHRLDGEYRQIVETLQAARTYTAIDSALALCPSINMLNTRYIIYNPTQQPLANPHAMGNCWFASEVEIADNADAEIAALNRIDPRRTAVVDRRFAAALDGFSPKADSAASISLEKYRPNRLTYRSSSSTEQLAVFSEIYYQPGWKATIDGQPAEPFRADWILRAMRIPAGDHTIVFDFHPDRYVAAAKVSAFSSFFILLILVGAAGYSIWKVRKESENGPEILKDKK
ncbi:MAG: YfhO family protein [Tannerellaceae bacterium]|jgi:hypothetical protein|nr:YfhO family protein [Tannerellaceae bacterium]